MRGNATIQRCQTPLSTYRVLLRWPLSQREKDLKRAKNLVFTCGVVPSELGRLALASLQFGGRPTDRHVPCGARAVRAPSVTRALVKLRLS